MKTTLFAIAVLAGLTLIPFWLHAQNFTLITTADTLTSGDIIITQTDINGNIIDKGLAMPGFTLENDTSVFTFSTPTPPDNDDGVFTGHIDVPGAYGGFLPQDIVFNPHNSMYYVYGYRKVLICNENLVPEKTIGISNRDDFAAFYSDYHQQMIDVNPTSNEVYCLTLEGSLIVIDEFYNKTVLVPPIENATVLRASMKYCPLDNSVVYFLLFTDEDGNLKTEVLKYMLTDGNRPNHQLDNDIIGYDLEFMPFLNSHRVFVATNNGIQVFNTDLSLAGNIEPGAQFGHIEGLNGLLFCNKTGVDEIVAYSPSGSLIHTISDAYNGIRFMLSDDETNQIYTSGFNSSGNGVKILTESSGTYSFTEEIDGFPNVFGLDQNTTQVVACGENEVVYINKVGYSPTQVSCTSLGQMYRVAATNSPNSAAIVQPLNGNAISFGTQQEDVLDIGGQASATCAKGDKIYVAVHKYNQEGYILVLNGSSGAIIHKIQPDFDFNPVDMFCSNDPETSNDNVYVVFVKMGNPDLLFVRSLSTDNNQFGTIEIDFEGDMLEYLITPNGTLCFGVNVGDFCPNEATVYFYEYDLIEKYEPITKQFACVTQFLFVDDYDYFVWLSKCNNTIYCFKETEIGMSPIFEEQLEGQMPSAVGYYDDANEKYIYCSYKEGSTRGIITIDLIDDFLLTEYQNLNMDSKIYGLEYCAFNNTMYGISQNRIYQISNPPSVIDTISLPTEIDVVKYREDDYYFDRDNGELKMITDIVINNTSKPTIILIDVINGDIREYSDDVLYNNLNNSPIVKSYNKRGHKLSLFEDKKNILYSGDFLGNIVLTTTHTETRRLTGNWDWISFPCMPRLGNEDYGSQSLLANIEELPEYLELNTKDGNYDLQLTYEFPQWFTDNLPTLISTQGYKYYTDPQTDQYLPVYGIVLDPTTPINLSSQYENWIGYFLEYPLLPEQAFAGIWDRLTRITTKSWTIYRVNGQMVTPSRVTPLRYGDGLIVEVSEDCTLTWYSSFEPADDYEYPETEAFDYYETAEYVPFYFEMDSTSGIQEIGLTVNDSCVGASVVEPSDSLVEVNAYLQGMPSGVPIQVETYSGFKSAKPGSNDYSVLDLKTGKRISRKIYTGEGRPYYMLSFKQGEETTTDPVAILQTPSPNPFSSSVMCSFVLNEAAAITMTLHDLQGNPVKTLMQGNYPEGYYETGWTGTTESGKSTDNGIYIIRLTANNTIIANKKVVFIR
jgi:hypothetical protein